MDLREVLRSLADHCATDVGVLARASLGLVGEWDVFMVAFSHVARVVSGCLHELVLRVQNVDVLQVLA